MTTDFVRCCSLPMCRAQKVPRQDLGQMPWLRQGIPKHHRKCSFVSLCAQQYTLHVCVYIYLLVIYGVLCLCLLDIVIYTGRPSFSQFFPFFYIALLLSSAYSYYPSCSWCAVNNSGSPPHRYWMLSLLSLSRLVERCVVVIRTTCPASGNIDYSILTDSISSRAASI